MAKQKKDIFKRLVEGPERSEDYARSTLPTNRWSLGWDLIKTNLGKIIKVNLLMLLFLFPIFLIFILRSFAIEFMATDSPFSQNLGIGYPVYPFVSGISENIELTADLIVFILLMLLSFYYSIGLAGGFYVMRNMVWTEGVFVVSDFWTGVKKNYKTVLSSTLVFLFFLGITYLSIDVTNYRIAVDPNHTTILTIFKVVTYVFIALFIMMYVFQLTMGVTYDLNLIKRIRNSLILTIGLLPVNAFFVLFSFIPMYLLLVKMTSFLFSIGVILIIFFSLSFATLVMTNYSQWVFDEFINDKVAGAKKYRGIYKKNTVSNETENFDYKKPSFTTKPVKPVTDYDVEIAVLPESYSRADLIKLEESKKRMIEDSDRYAEEHKDDYKSREETIKTFMDLDSEEDNSNDKK